MKKKENEKISLIELEEKYRELQMEYIWLWYEYKSLREVNFYGNRN